MDHLVERAMRRVRSRGFERLISTLEGGPPRALRLPALGPVRLWENWVHHEDVRRAQGMEPRPPDPETDAVLWDGLWAIGRYQRPLLDGLRIELRDRAGRRLAVGRGEPVVVSGPTGELALFLAGRREAALVELGGDASALARLQGLALGV
jgi:uncharacterized protein (TIGR03083 family)